MLLKILGAAAMIAAGFCAGLAYSRENKKVIEQVQALISSVDDMKGYIDMSRTPFIRLITNLSDKRTAASPIFSRIAEEIRAERPISDAIHYGCALIADAPSREAVETLFNMIGYLDADESIRRISIIRETIDKRCAFLTRQSGDRTPLVRKLCAAIGVCAAIIFL